MKGDSICECGHYDADHDRKSGACLFNTNLGMCAYSALRVEIAAELHDGQVTLRMPIKTWERLIGLEWDTPLAKEKRREL